MKPETTDHDVVIVGYGPVGRMLALKLGRRGHRVLVVERQRATYFLPRAVHIDDEACRILQSVGAAPDQLGPVVGPYDDFYEWRAADGQTILQLDWRGRGPSGWNVSNFFNQPLLERHLHALVEDEPRVQVEYGSSVVGIEDDGERVVTTIRSGDGTDRTVSARYLVGADGARSFVREWIGGTSTDLGYFHDWLVIDLVMIDESIVFDPPAWQLCDPARPTTLVPGGPGRRRFEFMRLPGESAEELKDEATAWRLLEPWGITPAQARLERNTVYTFQARWADTWRRGRVMIAGDAAHLMPPFAGQGMCSGLRDAVNLEWKLSMVLRGSADPAILDTYGPERAEHVRHFVEASMALGEVICITDDDAARARDTAMRADHLAGVSQPARPLPRLGDGFGDGSAVSGLLSVQTWVRDGDRSGLLDDVVPHDGVLLLAGPARLDPDGEAALSARGVRVVRFGPESDEAEVDVVDVDGALAAWFAEYAVTAVLVRPDFYVFGSADTAEDADALAERYLAALAAPVAA